MTGRPMTGAERARRYRRRKAAEGKAAHGLYEPFQPGNTVSLVHGKASPRVIGPIAERTHAELGELLGECPEYLQPAEFVLAIRSLVRAEAEAEALWNWLQTLTPEQRATPRRAGSSASPSEQWRRLDAHCVTLRRELGLSPLARIRIAAALAPPPVDIAQEFMEIARQRAAAAAEGDDGAA